MCFSEKDNFCINRIRLEFKEIKLPFLIAHRERVLIESDWNLKVTVNRAMLKSAFSINRIRLEFKAL